MLVCQFTRALGRSLAAHGAGLALLVVAFSGCRVTQPAEPALTDAQRAQNVESFDVVWTTIRDQHWDPELGGINWDAVREEVRPRVAAARTASEARAAMRDAIQRLRQSHFGLIPASIYDTLAAPESAAVRDGSAGIRVTVLDDGAGSSCRAVVRTVDSGSAAETAGVQPGWTIESIGDHALAPTLTNVYDTYRDSTLRDLRLAGAVESRLAGAAGTSLPVVFRDEPDRERRVELTLREPRGKRVGLGHLPPQYVQFDSRALSGGAGYIALNIFLDPAGVMPKMQKALTEFEAAPGVVLDLRGNPGGIAGMGVGMAGFFVDEPGRPLGTMRTRETELKMAVNPRLPQYTGPLAILIDGASASTSEIVAGGLKDVGRARVFGVRSAGAALPSVITRLPNGDGFQYAIANYTSAGGQPLEGVGVAPDVEIRPTREQLLAGRDPVLDAARDWIRAEAQPHATHHPARLRPSAAHHADRAAVRVTMITVPATEEPQ